MKQKFAVVYTESFLGTMGLSGQRIWTMAKVYQQKAKGKSIIVEQCLFLSIFVFMYFRFNLYAKSIAILVFGVSLLTLYIRFARAGNHRPRNSQDNLLESLFYLNILFFLVRVFQHIFEGSPFFQCIKSDLVTGIFLLGIGACLRYLDSVPSLLRFLCKMEFLVLPIYSILGFTKVVLGCYGRNIPSFLNERGDKWGSSILLDYNIFALYLVIWSFSVLLNLKYQFIGRKTMYVLIAVNSIALFYSGSRKGLILFCFLNGIGLMIWLFNHRNRRNGLFKNWLHIGLVNLGFLLFIGIVNFAFLFWCPVNVKKGIMKISGLRNIQVVSTIFQPTMRYLSLFVSGKEFREKFYEWELSAIYYDESPEAIKEMLGDYKNQMGLIDSGETAYGSRTERFQFSLSIIQKDFGLSNFLIGKGLYLEEFAKRFYPLRPVRRSGDYVHNFIIQTFLYGGALGVIAIIFVLWSGVSGLFQASRWFDDKVVNGARMATSCVYAMTSGFTFMSIPQFIVFLLIGYFFHCYKDYDVISS